MSATAATSRPGGRHRRTTLGAARNLGEPGSDRGERAHEAARPQQFATRPAPGGQKAVEPFLVDLVPVQQTIRGALIERPVFDVFAQDAGTLFVAATEEIAAFMMLTSGVGLAIVVVFVRHPRPPAR